MYKIFFKRFFDFSISLIALICLSPFLVVITIWLHFANKGAGAIFTQERPGMDEKIFKVFKFKSMTDERDENGKLLPDSQRLTKVGKFIRSTSIDELPQLINVLKGDMSFIGPRPILVEYLPFYTERERLRHTVRPGISGWAQVHGRNTVKWDERLEYDAYYAEHLSFLLDAKIFFMTVKNVLMRKDVSVDVSLVETNLKEERSKINISNMKTILVTGIGGLTPRSITGIIRENHPDYHIIGVDVNKKAVGFFMKGLLDEYYVCPRCTDPAYFPWIEKLVAEKHIDYAFVQPESEIVEWGDYYEKHGKFPVPVFMGSKLLSVSLKDKSIMADLLEGTDYIPKTIKVTQDNPRYEDVEKEIGFPCWIRATEGTGGLGSLKLEDLSSYKSWLFINSRIPEFTVSEFLTGRHLANEMLYYNGEYVKGAALECAEYVMANTAPSHVTGNTAFGRFLNEDRINEFCDSCIKYLEKKLGVPAHGILSFDLKEDKDGNMKVTEVNIRHMAYAGVMAHVGFDLIEDTIKIMEDGNADRVERAPFYHYEKPYIFLRDVDVEPIILDGEHCFPEA